MRQAEEKPTTKSISTVEHLASEQNQSVEDVCEDLLNEIIVTLGNNAAIALLNSLAAEKIKDAEKRTGEFLDGADTADFWVDDALATCWHFAAAYYKKPSKDNLATLIEAEADYRLAVANAADARLQFVRASSNEAALQRVANKL